jgi:hypothetical protein
MKLFLVVGFTQTSKSGRCPTGHIGRLRLVFHQPQYNKRNFQFPKLLRKDFYFNNILCTSLAPIQLQLFFVS